MIDAGALQARLDRLGSVFLLPLLAISTVLALISVSTGFGTWRRFDVGLGVVAVAAVFTAVVSMRRAGRGSAWLACSAVGHIALAAVLVGINPWYGVFAWAGYPLADELPGWWPWPGFVGTAVVAAASEVGGWPTRWDGSLVAYVVVAAINVLIVTRVMSVIHSIIRQNEERGVMIASLHDANARLEAALAENAALHAQLVVQARDTGVQDERQRLAGEIHDTLAQGLVGIVTQLDAALSSSDPSHVEKARALAAQGLLDARRSVRALRPGQLEDAPLPAAVAELVSAFAASSAVDAAVETTGSVRPLTDDVSATLFRVAQEGLTNVAKHADASKVRLTLSYLPDVVLLDVRDDGRGCPVAARDGGFGLEAMRHRLASLGGSLSVETSPGEGLALSASVPTAASTPADVPPSATARP